MDFDFLSKNLNALNDLCGTEKTAPEVDLFVKPKSEPPKFTRKWLMKHKKLVLIFGVQQTLLDQSRDKQALANLEDPTIHSVRLVSDIRCFCKLRDDLIDCLHMLQEKFVIGIYTTGSKEFGTQILKILDPDSSLILAGCCEATTKFGERSLKTFAASLGEGDVELDSKLCIICDTDFNTWVIEDHQIMMPLQGYRYWNPAPGSKADPMWPTTKLLLDLHELFFDKYSRQIASKHLIREVIGKANGMTMLKSFCEEVKVQVTNKTEESVTVLIQSGTNQLSFKTKNELERDAINEASRKFLVQLTGSTTWKGLQPKVLKKQPMKKKEIQRMKELMDLQKSSNLYKTALSPTIKPPSPLSIQPKRSFQELLDSSAENTSVKKSMQNYSRDAPNSSKNFETAPSPLNIKRGPMGAMGGIISPLKGAKGVTNEVSKILSLSAPRGIHLPVKEVSTPKRLPKKQSPLARTRAQPQPLPLPLPIPSPPVATKSSRTTARSFNNRNKRHLEATNAPASKRRKLPPKRNPTDLLNYSTKEHLLYTADFGKGPRNILNTVGPKRSDNRGCIQSKPEVKTRVSERQAVKRPISPLNARKGTIPNIESMPEVKSRACERPVVKKSVKPPNVRKTTIPSSARPYDYDTSRSRPVASKLPMRKTANGVMKYSIPKAKSGSAYKKKEAPISRKPVGKQMKMKDFMQKREKAKIPLKPSAIPRMNPLRKRQASDTTRTRPQAKHLTTSKRTSNDSKLVQELLGGSISDDSDDEEDLDSALDVIKRKKEAERARKAKLGASVKVSPLAAQRKPATPPSSQRKNQWSKTKSATFSQSLPQPSFTGEKPIVKKPTFTQTIPPSLKASTSNEPVISPQKVKTEPTAQPPVKKSDAVWPVPMAQQKFYPDYPPSEYYTFQPLYGKVTCKFCHKPKPSPVLLLCDKCKNPSEKVGSSFCVQCGTHKQLDHFHTGFSEEVCLQCLGMRVCCGCQNQGDARWFPKVMWENEDKDAYCFSCLGNFVQCPSCGNWKHQRTEKRLQDFCVCPCV